MTLEEKLDKLADEGGEVTLAPRDGQDLESFQADVSRVRDLERRGLARVISEHQESRTGHRYIDRLRLRLTDYGVEWRKRRSS
jgi:hypothetical protein